MSRTVLVCQHETCPKQGAAAVAQAFRSQVPADVVVENVGCLGQCGNGPMVVVLPEEIWYAHVAVGDVPKIVEQHQLGGKRCLYSRREILVAKDFFDSNCPAYDG